MSYFWKRRARRWVEDWDFGLKVGRRRDFMRYERSRAASQLGFLVRATKKESFSKAELV